MADAAIPRPRADARTELLGVARGVASLPSLARGWSRIPRGAGQPVLVLPGFLTGDPATLVLRRFLSAIGYRAYGWGLGRNHGRMRELLPGAHARVAELERRHGEALRLVGWSLGGVVARECAREQPSCVAKIVTMGTPVVGGPKYTAAAGRYERRALDLDELERKVAARNAEPLPVPVTAIYTKRDTIVAWQACIDPNPDNEVEHVEVDLAHSELGLSPVVLRLVASHLAAPLPR